MKNQLFREKSIERVTSPEQLNDYIRVANPGIWMILSGIILVLVGICVWGIFGRLDTTLAVGAMTEGGETVCYIKAEDIERVDTRMTVRAGDGKYEIVEIAKQPVRADQAIPEYLCHIGGISEGEWVYAAALNRAVGEEGSIFQAEIVLESIAPLSFVTN